MSETTQSYFELLAQAGYQPLLHLVSGTLRFDIEQTDGSHQVWHLTIDLGALDVRRETEMTRDVDCVLTGPEGEFAQIVFGHDSFAAAYVRGAITVVGNRALALDMRRFSPPAEITFG
jgi:SCP-2 sterol transfer family